MMVLRLKYFFAAAVALAVVGALNSGLYAQGGNGNGAVTQPGGVEIDARGVLNLKTIVDSSGVLDRQLALAARQALPKDLQEATARRMVSLRRLEAKIAQTLSEGKPLTDDLLNLAGMTRITHVFFDKANNDIIIAGPAEGFFQNGLNTVIGLETGAATLHLEDLVVALRNFAGSDDKKGKVLTCSIDPTPEGLARLRQEIATVAPHFRPGVEAEVAQRFRNALGMQTITINGVAPETRTARVMVEADYGMKLIGIGLVQPRARVQSFIAGASPLQSNQNSLMRWYFQPDYDCVRVNESNTAMELVGEGVRLIGEDERVAANGGRNATGKVNRASKAFCESFTREYDAMAKEFPVFGELRNIMDINIAAAFIDKAGLIEKSGWKMETFMDESLLPTRRFNAPTQVAPVVNAVWKDGMFMTPIGGGVSIQPRYALNSDRVKTDTKGEIDAIAESINLDKLAADQWWWD